MTPPAGAADQPSPFAFERLRRNPDVEADNLFAVDASDRLILAEAADAVAAAAPGEVVAIEDRYGALTLGAAYFGGARGIRVHQDMLSGELALARNAADVTVIAGGRIKHMAPAMNGVFARHFTRLDVSPARQKSRVLVANGPIRPLSAGTDPDWPHSQRHADLAITVRAHGAAFAGTTVDIGTRYLLEFLGRMKPGARTAIDLGCGTGVLAAGLALRRPDLTVIASDQSAAAVASAGATMVANGVADRVTVIRDDALASRPDASAELILLNPPFHIGSSVHAGIALKLFHDAARVLAPGGELWTVWNTHLGYRPALTRIVGPTHQVGRNPKFTVTVSTRS